MTLSGRPPCPCCVQRAEHLLAVARSRIAAALAAAVLTSLALRAGPPPGRAANRPTASS